MTAREKVSEAEVDRLHAAIEGFEGSPPWRRMRMRIRELGENNGDEVKQLRVLVRACREHAPLADAIVAAGFPSPLDVRLPMPTLEQGRLVQVFNAVIEQRW